MIHGFHGCDKRVLLVFQKAACGLVCAEAAILLFSAKEVLR